MADALILDKPMEFGLELVAVVRPHLPDSEREAPDAVVDEGDGIGLRVTGEDFQRPDAGGIVDRRVLISLDGLAAIALEGQELDVDLNLMAGNLLLIAPWYGPFEVASPAAAG